jgi:hypothetical protein
MKIKNKEQKKQADRFNQVCKQLFKPENKGKTYRKMFDEMFPWELEKSKKLSQELVKKHGFCGVV